MLLLASANLQGQSQDFHIKAFVKKNAIVLRWVPANKIMWEHGNKYGYKLERIELQDALSLDTSLFRKGNLLTSVPQKPWKVDDTAWVDLIKKEIRSAFVYNALYANSNNANVSQEERQSAEQANFGLVLLSADLSVDIAKASGFYWKDSSITNDKVYAYRLSLFNAPKKIKYSLSVIVIDASRLTKIKNISDLAGKFSDKQVELSWNVSENKSDYAAYVIERSEDSMTYTRVNTAPYVQLYSEYEKEKKKADYKDSLPQNGKYYYYRVKGLTHFGETGPASNVIKGKGKSSLTVYPLFDTVEVVENKTVQLYWRMPQGFDYNELQGYAIARAEKDDGNYTFINTSIIPPKTLFYTDTFPGFVNYYKVYAINKDADSASSYSWMVQLEDHEPPLVPDGLKGKVDNKGAVKISWNVNKERDLQGYRVFRSNSLKEEWVEVTRKISEQAFFEDSVNIHTLTEEIYYSVTAVDQVYNNSEYSEALKLKRPDIIPPVPPVFGKINITHSGIDLHWVPSTSSDVQKYDLLRSEIISKQQIKLIEWRGVDSLVSYTDSTVVPGKIYSYQIIVYDDDGNQAQVLSSNIKFESGVRPQIKTMRAKADYELHKIILTWDYPSDDLYNFIVYKAKQGEALRIFKTISPQVKTLEDKEVYINNNYEYKIKAIYKNGIESELSEVLEVEY